MVLSCDCVSRALRRKCPKLFIPSRSAGGSLWPGQVFKPPFLASGRLPLLPLERLFVVEEGFKAVREKLPYAVQIPQHQWTLSRCLTLKLGNRGASPEQKLDPAVDVSEPSSFA
jgi:hypothetical protein